MDLSIVIPVYNSENTIKKLINEIDKKLNNKYDYEIIFIDDYSKDKSFKVLNDIAIRNTKIKVIKLDSNYGQQNAIYAGLNFTKGKLILTMDDDLQHDISYIDEMIKKINEGKDLVYGICEENNNLNYKILGSKLRNIFFKLNFSNISSKVSSFRIFRKELIPSILEVDYKFIYLSGILLRLTSKVDYINIEKRSRVVGKSNYNFFKLLRLFIRLNYYYSPFISEKLKPKGIQFNIETAINIEFDERLKYEENNGSWCW